MGLVTKKLLRGLEKELSVSQVLAVVESENFNSWTWYIQLLKEYLEIVNLYH